MSGRDDPRLPARTVDYIQDIVGADVPRDLIKVALVEQDLGQLDVSAAEVDVNLNSQSLSEIDVDLNSQTLAQLAANIDQIGGQAQSAVDVANKINQINAALASVSNDSLRVTSPDPLDASAAEVDVDLNALSYGTVPVNQQSPVSIEAEDGSGLVGQIQRRANSAKTSIENSEIAVPVDIQASLGTNTQSYGQDITADHTAEVELEGYTTAEVLFANATTATDLLIEKSWDQTNYFEVDSQTGVQSYNTKYTDVTADYLRLTVTGTGNSTDTADVILGGAL